MANLLKNVQNSLQGPGQSQQPMGTPSGLATEQALQAGRAASGKAVQPGQGPKIDTTLERASAVQGQQAQQQVIQQTQAQQAALQAQEQQQKQTFRLELRSQAERKISVKSEAIQKIQTILDSYEKRNIEFDLTRQEADVEQAKFLIRLQDDQYMEQLRIAGARERLDDEFVFNVSLTESVFGEYYQMAVDQVGFDRILNTSRRDWEAELKMMEVKHELWQKDMDIKTKNATAKYSAMTSMTSEVLKGGTDLYSAKQKADKEKE